MHHIHIAAHIAISTATTMIKLTIDIPIYARVLGARIPFRVKRTSRVPESWAEIKPHHTPALRNWLETIDQNSGMPFDSFAKLLCDWMHIPHWHSAAISRQHTALVAKLCEPFIHIIKHASPLMNRYLYLSGPGTNLDRLTYGQFITAEHVMKLYTETRDTQYLRAIAALTFAPKWKPWSRSAATRRAALLRFAPEKYIVAMAYTFIGQRNNLPELYPELYDGPPRKSGPVLRIDQQILAMCGQELGGYEKVDAAPLHRVMELMQLKEITNRKNNPNYARRYFNMEKLHEHARNQSREHNAHRNR